VLAVLGRLPAAHSCLDAAAYAAGILGGARLIAMTTKVDLRAALLSSEEVLTAEEEKRGAAAVAVLRDTFLAWRAGHGIAAEWIETQGDIATEVARHGQVVELLVTAAQSSPEDRSGAALHAALLDTGRPVLVVPDMLGAAPGRRIAIAWHDDAPANHAVLSAIPFLAAAEHVWLIQGVRGGAAAPPPPALLAEHRITAEPHVVTIGHGDVGQALLDAAKALGADLLVMGAYAHRRLIEALLGGVTRSILHATDLPLLMQH